MYTKAYIHTVFVFAALALITKINLNDFSVKNRFPLRQCQTEGLSVTRNNVIII